MVDSSVASVLRNLRMSGTKFPNFNWDPTHLAMAIVADIAARDWRIFLEIPPPDRSETSESSELSYMLDRIGERAALGEEFIRQDETLVDTFMEAVGATRNSNPATLLLLTVCEKTSDLIAPHFKRMYLRPRPFQLAPALLPLIHPPGTPSYPQRHGLAAHLMAYCLEVILGGSPVFRTLAELVADNRVVAGLSYPSDLFASEMLAENLWSIMLQTPSFHYAITEAAVEWRGVTTTVLPGPGETVSLEPRETGSLASRFEAADERVLMVFEPYPDRQMSGADLERGLRYISDVILRAIAVTNALGLIADSVVPISAQDAFYRALNDLQKPPAPYRSIDPLSELELIAMGVGRPAWIEAFPKVSRRAFFALAVIAMPVVDHAITVADHGITVAEDLLLHRQTLDWAKDIVHDPKVTVTNKSEVLQVAGDDLKATQSRKELLESNVAPMAMPADAQAKQSVQHPPARSARSSAATHAGRPGVGRTPRR